VYIHRNFRALQAMARYAHQHSSDDSGPRNKFDFRYFMNVSNALFLKVTEAACCLLLLLLLLV